MGNTCQSDGEPTADVLPAVLCSLEGKASLHIRWLQVSLFSHTTDRSSLWHSTASPVWNTQTSPNFALEGILLQVLGSSSPQTNMSRNFTCHAPDGDLDSLLTATSLCGVALPQKCWVRLKKLIQFTHEKSSGDLAHLFRNLYEQGHEHLLLFTTAFAVSA